MQNKLSDLNNHLFAELERLGDEELVGESLTEEVVRAKAISSVSETLIRNASLILDAHKFVDQALCDEKELNLPLFLD